ncbi:MAG: hypothetical protein GY861_29245 [bacterium]|nr:hypothetical protein [bacterium]
MFKPRPTSIGNRLICDTLYISSKDMITFLKDELLYILSNPDEDELTSEYLKDRVALLEYGFEQWKDKRKKDS